MLLIPIITLVTITLGILGTVGMESFGKLLVNKNIFAIGLLSSAVAAILFLSHELGIVSSKKEDIVSRE